MSARKKYDFIIPIGWGCLNAHNLRKNKLQRESLPFDWLRTPSLSQVNDLLKTHFQNFLRKENLKFIKSNGDANIYRDLKTNVEYWHDFMIGEDFETSYQRNYKKYQRRINRMYHHIKHSQTVLWVRIERIFPNLEKTDDKYIFIKEQLPKEQVIENFAELQKLYPNKEFNLLLIYTYDEPREIKQYNLTPAIRVWEIYNDEKLGWQGDTAIIAKILAPYDLTVKAKIRYGINTLIFKIKKLFGMKTYHKMKKIK